ncbi:exocyst complex component 7-like isoform X2 [Sycon ciliatum]|uniref:exocyst complex component 7-like isoform X2 n=1 Tax=Sycon ciliatum TaxID=27933 RepID=UPI0031F6E99B
MEESVVSRRLEYEEKLERDRQNLQNIKDAMAKSAALSTNMASILNSFEDRLLRLENSVQPVYRRTQTLTRLQDNVAITLRELGSIVEYHHVADEVDQPIRDGPIVGDIESYLKLMDRVDKAKSFFQENNPGSMELANSAETFKIGVEKLLKEFRTILQQNGKTVPVKLMMDMAAGNADDEIIVEHLPGRIQDTLTKIANWLVNSAFNTEFLAVYFQSRSTLLNRSMTALREAVRHGGVNLPTKKPASAKDTPQRRPATNLFRREQTQRPRRMSLRDKTHTPTAASRSAQVPLEESVEGTYAFVTSCSVFYQLLVSERQLMQAIIPPQHHKTCFQQLLSTPLDFFIAEGENLNSAVKRVLSRNDYQAVLSGLKILQHLQQLLPQYQDLMKGLQGDPASRISVLTSLFENTCHKSLMEFCDYVKADPDKVSNMPKDGTVHELTSSTISFLQQCMELKDVIGKLLLPHDAAAQASRTCAPSRKALGSYFNKVLHVLTQNLEHKSNCYENPALQTIFRLNNFHFIHKSLTKSTDVLLVLEENTPDIEDNYNDMVGRERMKYQKVWSKALNCLMVSDQLPKETMSKSEREGVKEKFKGFNTEVDDLFRIQRSYAIPDESLRESVRQENIELIVPFYRTLLERYGNLPFTKNPSKYIRHQVTDVERILRSFFDASA